ncbi:MAG: arginine--tRNA ligase [Firmicutes bacterium]|nr:arginine--tRNA ligase [Bacillota bacterium]
MDYKKIISESIKLGSVKSEEFYSLLAPPKDASMGEWCLPCFKFAGQFQKTPGLIASMIKDSFRKNEYIASAEVVSGYVNFRLNQKQFIFDTLAYVHHKGEKFSTPAKFTKNADKTICIDYSSVNIAKPFHMGHLIATTLGGSLYRIYKYLGYKVIGINHLGDWGTQFGKLIVAFKRYTNYDELRKGGIDLLNQIYVRFHEDAEKTPSMNDEAREWFKKIEEGNSEALEIFEKFKKITLDECSKIYDRLGVTFDSYDGESFYNDKLDAVVNELKEKRLLSTSEGAEVVQFENDKYPPCLIRKSDGASLYATRDLAAALYRKKTYNFDKCLYVVAYQQNLHFQQVFEVLTKMGNEWAKDCIHVAFGMVSLKGGEAFSTRKGNVILLKDVLDTAEKKALDAINEKNPTLENKEETAKIIGTGASIFFALRASRIKDLEFSYEAALNFDGETGVYVQYTHARCASILSKSSHARFQLDSLKTLLNDETFNVCKVLSEYDEIVQSAAHKNEPSFIARYLIDLSSAFNQFYIKHKVSGDPSRLLLVRCVKNVLKNGMELLLMQAPDKM